MSYSFCVDLTDSAETELALPTTAEPKTEVRTRTSVGDTAGDWLCAWCLNQVAHDRDRFKFDGKDRFTFSNPEGIAFKIIIFSQTLGCSEIGSPTLEHTWFPGHAWLFCQCDRCRQHLGWYYLGPHDFAGLIVDRIVRGRCIRN